MWVQLAIIVVMYIISSLLAPKPVIPLAQPPQGVPSISDTQPIPVVFGTCDMDAPNVVWYGDLRTDPIYASSGSK